MTATTVQRGADPRQDERATARRAERYAARSVLWRLSDLAPVRKCGRVACAEQGIGVRVSTSADGRRIAGYSGLATCGSVWACPVCSAKVAAVRQDEIERGLTTWQARGGQVAMVTLTMRHRAGQALDSLWSGVSAAWTAATSGREWRRLEAEAGTPVDRVVTKGARKGETVTENKIPRIRVVEVTHGANGWHVHVHALVLLAPGADGRTAQLVGESMFRRWSGRLQRDGFEAPTLRHGLDARLLVGAAGDALGEYFTKNVYRGRDTAHGASFEAARGDLKDARGGNRSPFAILRGLVDVHTTGELGDRRAADVERDERLWAEWERASRGRRQIVWSQGLRSDLLPEDGEELTDEQIAEAEHDGETVAWIDSDVWREVIRARADLGVLLAFERSDDDGRAMLALAESHGWRALIRHRRARVPGATLAA